MNFIEHVKIRNEKFGAVIFDTLTEKIFITNETGRDILNTIQQGYELSEIEEELKKLYNENREMKKDITDFINYLKENNFIMEN